MHHYFVILYDLVLDDSSIKVPKNKQPLCFEQCTLSISNDDTRSRYPVNTTVSMILRLLHRVYMTRLVVEYSISSCTGRTRKNDRINGEHWQERRRTRRRLAVEEAAG